MRKFLVLPIIIILSACSSVQLRQGIEGQIFWVSGNQMPGPDTRKPSPNGIQRELHIYELTTIEETSLSAEGFFSDIKTKLVAVVSTKEDGSFKLRLPPGKYSIFVKEEAGLFANLFDTNNVINPIVVEDKQYAWLTIKVNYQAAY